MSLPVARYAKFEMRAEFIRRMEEEIRRLPGVTSVGLTSQLPLTGSGALSPFAYDEATAQLGERHRRRARRLTRLLPHSRHAALARRFFDEGDRGANVIIIDETLAARAWPGQNAVGKRLQIQPTGSPNAFAEVIGVVEHIRSQDADGRFRIVALLLAAAGICGVISYSVSQRTKEIGIRMAPGQDAWQVRNLVVGQGLRLVAISLVIGLGGALALATTVSGLLYGVNPWDPLTFGGMAAFLLVVSLIGCRVPARRLPP